LRISLSSNLAFSALVIILAAAASCGIPIKHVAWLALAAALVILALDVPKILAGRRRAILIVGAVVMCGALAFAIGSNSLRGGFPSENPDCWAYAAFGQYLTDFSRGTHLGLSYVDEFAQGLSNSRFGSAALLGFLSQVFNTNTARAIVILDGMVLANLFLGAFCVTRAFGANSISSLASAAFSVCNGWTVRAIREGQLDNLVFLSLGVLALARTILLLQNVSNSKALIGIGANVAAACYCYPEGTAIAGVFVLPFGVAVLFWLLRDRRRRSLKVIFIICCIALFVAPYWTTFRGFVLNQIATTSGPIRPGEGMYPGLTINRLFPAFFALGEEMSSLSIEPWRLILPSLLSLLLLLGVLKCRFRYASATSLLLLGGAVGFELVHFHYDYAAYKFIFTGIIIWIPMIFVGMSWLSGLHRPAGKLITSGFIIVIFGGTFAQRALSPLTAPFHDGPLTDARRIRKYEEIKALGTLIDNATLTIACADSFKYLWAYFFARQFSVELLDYKSSFRYRPEILTYRERPTSPPSFVLSDESEQAAIWTNGQFWLCRVSDQPRVEFSESENSLEMKDGQVFTWIGNKPTTFEIISATKGKIRLSCSEVLDGPSLPEKAGRSVRVSVDGQVRVVTEQDLYALDLTVGSGITRLELSCLDRPTRLQQENGDTRIMLLGLRGFRVSKLSDQ
jgi:hypothetical protein